MNDRYSDIVSQYTDEAVTELHNITGGHINLSLLIWTGRDRYVLQCLDPAIILTGLGVIEDNYLQYRSACEAYAIRSTDIPGMWICPEWLKDRDGRFLHKDAEGRVWRMYRYIPGDVLNSGADSNTADHYMIGKGLGKLHKILKECEDGKINAVLPYLHDLPHYLEKYREADIIAERRDEALDKIIEEKAEHMLALSFSDSGVIHGDAKVSNMIIRDGVVVGFVDLDTLMYGSVYEDLADCMRSCCLNETFVLNEEASDMLIRGYTESSDRVFDGKERELIKLAVIKNCYTLGLRYYTDHLTGSRYFKESYPGENLYKARRILNAIAE